MITTCTSKFVHIKILLRNKNALLIIKSLTNHVANYINIGGGIQLKI